VGWFSPDFKINTRQKGDTIEYYGVCATCDEEYSHRKESYVESYLKKCKKKHDEENTRKAKAKREREEIEEKVERRRQEAAERDKKAKAEKEREKKAKELRNKIATSAREQRRIAKGKCPWCKKQPCKGEKVKCSLVKAEKLESITDFDITDPGAFDEQIAFYNKYMK
jgi:hypothetical protein